MTRALVSLVALIALLLPLPAWSAADAPPQDLHFDSNGVKIRYTVQGEGEPVVLELVEVLLGPSGPAHPDTVVAPENGFDGADQPAR